MILADGARADVMKELWEQGELPNIRENLPTLRTAVTSFPSTTGPAYLPYLTGCYPGTCDVPGIRWFDKTAYADGRPYLKRHRSYVGIETYLMNHDLARGRATLFDLLKPCVSIFSTINRGVGWRGNRTKFSRIWHWYYAHLTDRWGLVDEAAGEKTVAALRRQPSFLFVVFPGIDEYSHLASPFHPRVAEAYRVLDRWVGRIVASLKKEGRWEETLFWIVSDHGLSETASHLGLNQFLESAGLKTFYYPRILFRGEVEAASMVSGNGMANLYLKNGHGWAGRAAWDEIDRRPDRLIDRLLERPEIDLVAGTGGDGTIVVRGRRGKARIRMGRAGRDGDFGVAQEVDRVQEILYEVEGSDPFGYPVLPKRLSDRDLLKATFGSDYPDAPAQLLQIFRSRRAGDLVLSAAKGSDLRQRFEVPEHKSSHGSLHWEHMRVPVVTNVPLGEEPLRSVDIFATTLSKLGRPVPAGIDGRSF